MRRMKQFSRVFMLSIVMLFIFGIAVYAETVTINMTARYGQTEARNMLTRINEFRASQGVWCWNENGTKDTVSYANLEPLEYDYELEQIAMLRAMEIALSYSHTRPNGGGAGTVLPDGWTSRAENIAVGYTSENAVFEGWKEENENYSGQGHRRNMLSSTCTAIGIGHVIRDGYDYWVQVFRSPTSSQSQTTANDSETSVDIQVDPATITSKSFKTADGTDTVSVIYGEEIDIPVVNVILRTSATWSNAKDVTAKYDFEWNITDPAIASINGGKIKGLKVGSTTITSSFAGETVTMKLKVDPASISNGSVADISAVTYNGKGQTPVPVLTVNDKTLSAETDYDVTYSNNTNAGTAFIELTGKGNYAGTRKASFTILPAELTPNNVGFVNNSSYTYTGTAFKPDVSVKVDATELISGTDYSVSYGENINAGTGTVDVTGAGNYTGSIIKEFTISERSISDAAVGLGDSPVYTGMELEVPVTLTYNGQKLSIESDYNCKYSNNIDAGTDKAEVLITGVGNFTGTISRKFSINPADLSEGELSELFDATYSGVKVEEAPVVKLGGRILTAGSDYSVTYSGDTTNAGIVTVAVKGTGNYTNGLTGDYRILQKDISGVGTISAIADQTYTGSSITPDVTVTIGSAELNEVNDYTVSYGEDTVNAGEVTVSVTGTGNYTGTITGKYRIQPRSIEGGNVSEIASYTYTGEAFEPSVTVTLGEAELKKQSEFTVSYANNQDAGTGKVTVSGTGNYTGSLTGSFTIIKRPITDVTIAQGPAPVYSGQPVSASVSLMYGEKQLVEERDFHCEYNNNVDAGTDSAGVTITGNGNFGGKTTVLFSIVPADLSDGKISGLSEAVYNGQEIKESPIVEFGEKTLLPGTDYTVSYSEDTTNTGTVTVFVNGTGNYAGTLTGEYAIQPRDISIGSISTINPQTFTGNKVEPDFTVMLDEAELVKGTDYLVKYSDNRDAGTASVTVTGQNNYTGSVSTTFTVLQALITQAEASIGEAPVYTGGQVQAPITLTYNGQALTEGDDYTCVYSNNVNACSNLASVTITGIGNYTGDRTESFSISQANLSGGSIGGLDNAIYTGSGIERTPVVTMGGVALTSGTDYSVSYSDDIVNAGRVTVTITGSGNYTGTLTGYYTIEPKDISGGSVSDIESRVYTGYTIEPDVTTMLDGNTLVKGTDYTVSYSDNINAGNGKVSVVGTGNYKGSIDKTFIISQVSVEEADLSLGETPVYTGEAVAIPITLSYHDMTLKEGTDFRCEYSNNVSVGTNSANVRITGLGNFKGERTSRFSIIPADISTGNISGLSNEVYNGTEIKKVPIVSVNGRTLTAETEYTVTYSGDLINVGTVTVTITGKGFYQGTLQGSYSILEEGRPQTVSEPHEEPQSAPQNVPVSQTEAGQTVTEPVQTVKETVTAIIQEPVTIPKTPASVKAKVKKNKVTVSWKKLKKTKKNKKTFARIKQIEIQYSTDRNFTENVNSKYAGKKKTKVRLSLNRKTTYFVRVRFRGDDGVSAWSKTRKIKTR